MSRLLNHLPPYEQESEVFQEIMKAMEAEFDELFFDIEDLDKQLNPDTATWGLAILEKELGLPISPDLDINTRRSLIKSRLLMQPPGSKTKLVEILKTFVETAEIEEHFSEYRFDVILKTRDTLGEKVPHVRRAIEEFKPAHLDYMFVMCYLTDLLVTGNFTRWFSIPFGICGTRDISGNKHISTIGQSYKDKAIYASDSWLSLPMTKASEITMIDNVGLSYSDMLGYRGQSYVSRVMPRCSENTYTEEAVA